MIRTLHCSTNTTNYNLCLEHKVAGFTHRGPVEGDIIYLLYKNGKKSLCGARFVLDQITDEKPWDDADNYVLCYSIKDIEYCKFFDMSFLSEFGGKYWPLMFMQGAKAFKDEKAIAKLDELFTANKVEERTYPIEQIAESEDDEEDYSEEERKKIEKAVPDAEIKIMGTFQTINFRNETDSFRGLEKLVSENFFKLFPNYPEEHTILISENRLFKTQQKKETVIGESRIPDALMITFDKNREIPLRISLVEYECYGEGKLKTSEKSKYMNSHIIPQLMQFASSFSTITDKTTRDNTISDWIEKIETTGIDIQKVTKWMKELNPEIQEAFVISQFEKELKKAFNGNIHVYLIIDELSPEQKETIKNIIAAFKLETGQPIIFDSNIVRLVQKINFVDSNFEYGLTAQ